MSKLRQMVLTRKYIATSDESNAEKLIRLLSDDETISFFLQTGSHDEATQLMRVRKKHKSKVKNVNR